MLPAAAEYPPPRRGPVTTYGPFTIEVRGGRYTTMLGPVNPGLPVTDSLDTALANATVLAEALDKAFDSTTTAWERLTTAWNTLSRGRATVDLSEVAPFFPGGAAAPLVLGWSIARLQGAQSLAAPDGRRLSVAAATGFYQQPKNQHLRVYVPSIHSAVSGWFAPMRILPELRDNAGPPANVLDPDLYLAVKEEARNKFDVYPSIYANAWLVRTYKKRGGRYADAPQDGEGGLIKWFDEEWVDLSRPVYDAHGAVVGFEPCGRSQATPQSVTGDYPKCRPLATALKMTPTQREDAVRRKRVAEAATPARKGRSPVMVATYASTQKGRITRKNTDDDGDDFFDGGPLDASPEMRQRVAQDFYMELSSLEANYLRVPHVRGQTSVTCGIIPLDKLGPPKLSAVEQIHTIANCFLRKILPEIARLFSQNEIAARLERLPRLTWRNFTATMDHAQPVFDKLSRVAATWVELDYEVPLNWFYTRLMQACRHMSNYLDYVASHPRPVLKMASFADFIYSSFGVLAAVDDEAAYNRVVALTNEMLQAL